MSTIGNIGELLGIRIKQGSDWGPFTFKMTNPPVAPALVGTPVDLTGCSIVAQIRNKAFDPVIAATISTPVTSALNGEYQAFLPNAATSLLTCGSDAADPKSQKVWDAFLIDSLGRKTPLYYGPAIVYIEVSK
jgi:hypothetical protein